MTKVVLMLAVVVVTLKPIVDELVNSLGVMVVATIVPVVTTNNGGSRYPLEVWMHH